MLTSTALGLGNYCGDTFSGQNISFKNTGGGAVDWSVTAPASFAVQPSFSGTLRANAVQTIVVSGTKAIGIIHITWGDSAASEPNSVDVASSCTPPPAGQLDVLTPKVALSGNCLTNFSGDEFSFTNSGGTQIYWTVVMPTGFTLAANDPASGSLPPFRAASQNEFFQGIAANATIDIDWGYSASSQPFTGTVTTSCAPIG